MDVRSWPIVELNDFGHRFPPKAGQRWPQLTVQTSQLSNTCGFGRTRGSQSRHAAYWRRFYDVLLKASTRSVPEPRNSGCNQTMKSGISRKPVRSFSEAPPNIVLPALSAADLERRFLALSARKAQTGSTIALRSP